MRTIREFLCQHGFVVALIYLSVVSVGLFTAGAISNHTWDFWYLTWNLFLAWLPLVFVLWLLTLLRRNVWTSWPGITLTLLWLGFLPNSFYMVSDFIHLQDYQRVDIVFDTVMFSSFVLCGLLVGFTSLYLVHEQLRQRLRAIGAWLLVALVLLLCSFAIYLGRDLRMNTWDVLTDPAGILFDVSDPITHPAAHLVAFTTTTTFFVFLMSVYIVAWQLIRTLRRPIR